MKHLLPDVHAHQWLFSSPSSVLLEVLVVWKISEVPDQHWHDCILFKAPNDEFLILGNVHKDTSELEKNIFM